MGRREMQGRDWEERRERNCVLDVKIIIINHLKF